MTLYSVDVIVHVPAGDGRLWAYDEIVATHVVEAANEGDAFESCENSTTLLPERASTHS